MNFFTSDQTEERIAITLNLEERPVLEIKPQLCSCNQKSTFQPLEPIYEEDEEDASSSDSTPERSSSTSSTNEIEKSSLSGSTDKLSSIASITEKKPYEWTNFIKSENLEKTVITDLKRKYPPFEHKKVKSALEDECDKEAGTKEWPFILDLRNYISYFPYSDNYVVQDLHLDSISKFPLYEEKKHMGKTVRSTTEAEEITKKEDIKTTLYLPSFTPPSSVSSSSISIAYPERKLDEQSIPTLKRKEFMQLMDDSEKAEFQKLIEELDTKKQDDLQLKKEQKVQQELHFLSAKAPPPPGVISSERLDEQLGDKGPDMLPESAGETEGMLPESVQKGEDEIPAYPRIPGESETSASMEREGAVPAFPWISTEGEVSEITDRGEGAIPVYPRILGEAETPGSIGRGEYAIPAYLSIPGEGALPIYSGFPGETEVSESIERGEGALPIYSGFPGETEVSESRKSKEIATAESAKSAEASETATSEETSSLGEDKEDVPSYTKYTQAVTGIGEGEGEFIQQRTPFQMLETKLASPEDFDLVQSLLHDIVRRAETEAQKLEKSQAPINSWEEDYNICFKKYLKTIPESIRNLIKVIPTQLKEQVYEYSSEAPSRLSELPGISDTIKSDNLLIDQNQLISLTQKACPIEVLSTATDCKDEIWIPKLNAYYAYTEEIEPAHRLGQFMYTALKSLQQKYEAEELSFDMEDFEIDKEIRVLPNRYCLEFGTEDPYDEYLSELKYLQSKPLRCIIFGKPGLETKQLAKKMAGYWRCIYINVREEVKKELASGSNVAQMLKGILQAGDVAPGALVFRIILQRMLQPMIGHQGYILDGFPYHSKEIDLAPLEQLQCLFSWEFRPNIIVYLACPDAEVIRKRVHQYYDIDTENYYSSREISLDNTISSLYIQTERKNYNIQVFTDNTKQEIKKPNNLSWAKRFVRRELDFKKNIVKELEYYKVELLPCIEFFILQYEPQFVIRVDGRRDSSQIFKVVMQRLFTLAVQKSVVPQPFFPLPPEEPEKTGLIQLKGEERQGEGKQMKEMTGEEAQEAEPEEETEVQRGESALKGEEGEGEGKFEDPFLRLSPPDVIEALINRDTLSPQFTWQLSGWQFNCPVLLFEGVTKMGETRFAVRYLDKIYFLSSVEALKRFCENPRKYLMPPYPKPGCKYFIVGPQYFGRSLLALYIAEVFGAKIIFFEELKEKNTRKKREEHVDACRKLALEKAIASTKEMLNQKWLEAENERTQRVEKWMDDVSVLLEKYMEYMQEPPVESIQSSEGEAPGENVDVSQPSHLSEMALLLEEAGIPVGQDSTLIENLLQNSERLMEFLPSHLQPLPKPGTPDITHPAVSKAVDKAVFEAQKDHIELTREELIVLLDKEISDAEQDLIRRTNGQVTTGGWVVDGIPLDLQLCQKLVEWGMHPDHVICLMDDEPDVQFWQRQLASPLFSFSLQLLCEAARLRNQKYKYLPQQFSNLYNTAPTTDDMVFPAKKNLPSDDEEELEGEGGSKRESSEMGPPNTEDSIVSVSSNIDESSDASETASKESSNQHESLHAGDSVISPPTTNDEPSGVSRTISKAYAGARAICFCRIDSIFDTLFREFIRALFKSQQQAEESLPPESATDVSLMKTIPPHTLDVYGEDSSQSLFIRSLVESILPPLESMETEKRLSDQKAITAWIYEEWKKAIYTYTYSDFCIDYPSDEEEEAVCDESKILLADKIQLLQRSQLQQDLQPLSGEYRGESSSENFVRKIDRFNEDWVRVKEALAHKLFPLEINIHNRNINDIISDTIAKIEDEYRVHPTPYHSEAGLHGEDMGEFQEEVKEDIFLGDTSDYCPVALHNNFVLWHGKKNLAAKYNNKVYYFSTEEAMDEFMQKPYKFAPMSKPACGLPPIRICFVGPIGSGKTMLGKLFSLRLGLKLFSLNEEINKFVKAMGWTPMGRGSQNFFISVSDETLGEHGEGTEEQNEESIPTQDENTTEQEDEMGEYMGEHGGPMEGPTFEQKMLNDLKCYYAGGLLPEWLVQTLIVPLWLSKEGFILEGFPSGPEDVELMRKYFLIPDVIINLQVLEKTMPSRVLPSFLEIWQRQQDQEKQKTEEQDNEKRMRYEKRKARRRKELIWKLKVKLDLERLEEDLGEYPHRLQGDIGGSSELTEEQTKKSQQGEEDESASSLTEIETQFSGEDFWDFQSMPDLEDWLNQQKNSSKLKKDLQRILDAEFPPLILAHAWEDEVHAALRLKNILKKWYNEDMHKINNLRKPIHEINIPWEDVSTDIPLQMLLEGAAKRATELSKSDAMFEQTYEIPLEVATSLLECGYYFISRFGYWCPVQVAEKTNPIQMYLPAKESENIYPIIHRKYIYFLGYAKMQILFIAKNFGNVSAGQENAQKFMKDPMKYLNGEWCSPVVPVRLAIVGPPKSGKSTTAQRLARKFGIKVITVGGAIRHVLQDMADTELANNILRVLQSGDVISDELAVKAVEVAALEDRSTGQGFIYDGFPNKKSQILELAKHSLLPYAVIVLKSGNDHCLANLNRADLATFRVPLRYSAPYFKEMFNNWEKGSLSSFKWISQEYQNLIFVDAEVSEWQLGRTTEQTVLSVMQNVQNYFINSNKGLPALVQYLCVNRSEWEQRKTCEILHYCPVCLQDKSLVTSGPNPDRSGLLQYLCHLYWVCSDHKECFMRNPECYVASPDFHLPDELPQRIDEYQIEIGHLFADGMCVVCYYGKNSHGNLNRGITANAVEYNNKIYLFCSEECLSSFMKCPHKYKDLTIHFTNFGLQFIDDLQQMPVQGFLEQAVYETIIKCLSFVGTQRPKILGTKAEVSAAVYLGLLLKVNNKKASIQSRKKFKVALKRFMHRKRKVEKITKMFTGVANPHFDWMKEIAETALLPKKAHKKKAVAEESEESKPSLPSETPSFGPCGYIYPVGAEDASSIDTVKAVQSTTSSLSGYRGRAPTPRSGSGTSIGSAWLY